MTLDERLRFLEKLIQRDIPEEEIKECVFCKRYGDSSNQYTGYLTYKFNSWFFANDLVKQALFAEFGSYTCNHEIIAEESIDVANFIFNSIASNNANIDPYNPNEFIGLVSDFKKMDEVLDDYKNGRDKDNFDTICNLSKNYIRNAGRKWMMSLDPDKYDVGYLYMIEKYGRGFDLPKLYWESGYQDIQKEKLVDLGIGCPFNN